VLKDKLRIVINVRKFIIGLVGICFVAGAAYLGFNNAKRSEVKDENYEKNIYEVEEKNDNHQSSIDTVKITAVGDILIHESQLQAQLNKSTKQYDFNNNYKYVKEYIKNSDIAIANLETSLSRGENGYTGYPVFISPASVVDALKATGFNILATANNHIYDGGSKGFFTTQQILREKGIDYIGTRNNEQEDSFLIKNVKGIKVGITNYTYENSSGTSGKKINSVSLDKKVEKLIDTFNNKNIQSALNDMKIRAKAMRDKGAEVLVFYIHWGEEYERQPNKTQKELAQGLADIGIDIVFASHPHVLQPIEFVKSKVDNRETLVVYSLGNFISNQRYEILKHRYGEDGLIVSVNISKDRKNNKITLEDVTYTPTWVNRYDASGNFVYEVVPVNDGLKNKQAYNLITDEAVWRVENSRENTMDIIEKSSDRLVLAPAINSDSVQVNIK
jgi:poly-gamma-glutamate synthesis protein (capsule biosynthesis protein)